MKKILWHSVSPLLPTGYGAQTALFAPKIGALPDIDMAISSGFGFTGRTVDYGGVNVYPGENWNKDVLMWRNHFGRGDPVTVITLMDVWPLDRNLFRFIADQPGGLACWVPIDHEPVPPRVADWIRETRARPIAMSRFGEQQLRLAGFDDVLYVPHGVDTTVFQPFERDGARSVWGFDPDAFIVGMVANNEGVAPPRKAFPQALRAFKDLRDNHPDALLYLHTDMTGSTGRGGVDLRIWCDRFDIPDEAILYTAPAVMADGVTPKRMATLYASFDVLLNPSYGEGFGIPILEAQACGTPVVVTDCTSMTELCGAGWLVDGQSYDDCTQYATWKFPDVDCITAALEQAYEQRGSDELRAGARDFAMHYDADRVMSEYWLPTLEALDRPREVGPLSRAQRRAKKVAA